MRFSDTIKGRKQKAEGRSAFARRSWRSAALLPSAFCLLTAQQDISEIVVPVHASLAPLLPEIERQVPKTVTNGIGYQMDSSKQFGVCYRVERDPIALNMQGKGLHATTTMHFALEGCRRTHNPINGDDVMWPCVSCGFGEPMRQAYIDVDAHLEWDAQWHIVSHTTIRPAEFPNRCQLTLLNLDITDRVIAPIINHELHDVAKTIDQNTPKTTNVRGNAQQIWSALQAPYEVAPKTYLVIEPLDFSLGPLTGSGLTVASTMLLRARTRVVLGDRPATTAKPLPPLQVTQPAAAAMRVPFDVEVPYAEASRLISENFGAKTYKVSGAELRVASVRLLPPTSDKLTIEADIDYRGGFLRNYNGLIYLDATPQFDPATSSIVLTNVDFALDPHRHNPFLRIGDHLTHEEVRSQIAKNAKWSVAPDIASVRDEIQRSLNRPLTNGVALRGHIDSIAPVSITPTAQTITIRVLATGSAEVDVREWK